MKTSCDFDEDVFVAFRAHCREQGKTVTGALQVFMKDVLRTHGKLPGDPIADVAVAATELAREHGPERVRAKLSELAIAVISGGGR
jgi:hypothetical protein